MSFPFDHVVITFPDIQAAQAARSGPLDAVRNKYMCSGSKIDITADTDPFGARVGSGGGTLAQLHKIFIQNSTNDKSVLILHAGGESSRCPNQMVLGKAWTSLPVSNIAGDNTETREIKTPIDLWFQLCTQLFADVPAGTVVVVASDTLLQLPKGEPITMDWSRHKAVFGLAVPAPLHTAKNHGVYHLNSKAPLSGDSFLSDCCSVLQKPRLETLLETCSFPAENDENMAWIDTGVVVFPPLAAQALYRLACGPLQLCTEHGLQTQWNQECEASLSHFAKSSAVKIDLYTHILQALRLADGDATDRRKVYCKKQCDLSESIANRIFDEISQFSLEIWAIPKGRFLHLGTTRELQDFLVSGSYSRIECLRGKEYRELYRQFGTSIGLVRRLRSMVVPSEDVNPSAVIYHSFLRGARCSIDADCLIEHSFISTTGSIHVGRGSLVSGFRTLEDAANRDFYLPKHQMLQMIPITSNERTEFAYMVLGIDDNVKLRDSFFGIPIEQFLKLTGCAVSDIWVEGSDETTWNAKLHPSVHEGDSAFVDYFSWLQQVTSGRSCSSDKSLQRWKTSKRLSLCEIRDSADASIEFRYRNELLLSLMDDFEKRYYREVQDSLTERRHSVLDYRFAVDDYASCHLLCACRPLHDITSSILNVLEIGLTSEIILYDVCGRACMVYSFFLDEMATVAPVYAESHDPESHNQSFSDAINALQSDSDRFEYFKSFVIKTMKDTSLEPQSLFCILSSGSYAFSLAMTRGCVCTSENFLLERKCGPIINQWLIATAPARIDFAGGWSDTPPICFEYGSSVTGVAVLIDGKKPLSCRCRIKTDAGTGVFLRSELRNHSDGDLLSVQECRILSAEDLRDYQNPQSNCALLKCAVLCLGLVPFEELSILRGSLQAYIDAFCQTHCAGIEIVATSLLPQGSGLGTSSILAGCVLAAIGRCVGIELETRALLDAVSILEQHLTTGGGFQDQVNGLIGGVKTVRCQPCEFPLQLEIEPVKRARELPIVLVYTGQTRLAKNILQNVLRRWSQRRVEIVATVEALVKGSSEARRAVEDGDYDKLGAVISEYWMLKREMAGMESGVEPSIVKDALALLSKKQLIRGGSLTGAGGGGFMVLIPLDGVTTENLAEALSSTRFQDFRWHQCVVSEEGLCILNGSCDPEFEATAFDLSWHL